MVNLALVQVDMQNIANKNNRLSAEGLQLRVFKHFWQRYIAKVGKRLNIVLNLSLFVSKLRFLAKPF